MIVVKVPSSKIDRRATVELLYVEAMIYQRLGPHPFITKFYAYGDGIVYLELLQWSLLERLTQIYQSGKSPTTFQTLRWLSQNCTGI
jgi:hypothetical protein